MSATLPLRCLQARGTKCSTCEIMGGRPRLETCPRYRRELEHSESIAAIIRAQPDQQNLCLWLKETVATEPEFDVTDGKRYRWTYQRRCREPLGHEGPHVMVSFPVLREEVPNGC
jgi:hypothetical protein